MGSACMHAAIEHTIGELGHRVRVLPAEIEHFERGSMPPLQKGLHIVEAIAEERVDAFRWHAHGDDVYRDIT